MHILEEVPSDKHSPLPPTSQVTAASDPALQAQLDPHRPVQMGRNWIWGLTLAQQWDREPPLLRQHLTCSSSRQSWR
eukprot:CAMPEP_0175215862 /NCGR_PEP_ID=MMETSP0093-20121207/17434_1 /TAXON_ID=311494 /ORGANISM="Alexandrium monilatum, Strain CCMP3105" /LENGTH=76 /DNA_ID=CAMNT_0016509245 /DNA_START=201 /DNA_END=427 /DNA_ORIENTATION=+